MRVACDLLENSRRLRLTMRAALIAASAGLVWLCMPSAPWVLLPFTALVPFALSLRGCGLWDGLLIGWSGGALIWGVSIWWVFNGFVNLLGMSSPGALAATAALCLYQGVPYGLLGLACGWLERRGRRPGPLICSGLLTLLVVLRPVICPGTPAVALHSFPLAIQAADLGGMHFIGFLLFLANWLAAEALARLHSPSRAVASAAILAVLLAGIFGYGAFRLGQYNRLAGNAQPDEFLTITSIQPNIPIADRDGLDDSGPFFDRVGAMLRETERAAAEFGPANLVLWPEIPGDEDGDCESLSRMGVERAAMASGGPILAAFVEYDYGDNRPVIRISKAPDGLEMESGSQQIEAKYNALWLVGPDGCAPVYRKVRLVPFSERNPLREARGLLGMPAEDDPDYSPGAGPVVIELANGKRVQPLICFESGFPMLTREGVRLGADGFVNVSNDAWFASETASRLHLAMAVFRTVELRRPLVSCSNNGAGAHIRATGEVVPGTLTPMDVRTSRQARLHCPENTTPFARLENSWLWVLAVLIAGSCKGRHGSSKGLRPS